MPKPEKLTLDDVSKLIFIQWESEYIDDEDKGAFHLYAHTVLEGVKTIPHGHYLCEKKISVANKPLDDRFLDYLQEGNGYCSTSKKK